MICKDRLRVIVWENQAGSKDGGRPIDPKLTPFIRHRIKVRMAKFELQRIYGFWVDHPHYFWPAKWPKIWSFCDKLWYSITFLRKHLSAFSFLQALIGHSFGHSRIKQQVWMNFVFYRNFWVTVVLHTSKERAILTKSKEPFLKSAAVFFKICLISKVFGSCS